jgi:hypothetical protein
MLEHRASSIEHRASSIEHRASSIEHRASSIEHRASSRRWVVFPQSGFFQENGATFHHRVIHKVGLVAHSFMAIHLRRKRVHLFTVH